MCLEFMQENSNQLQKSRRDFFLNFYHLSCWEPPLPSQIRFPNLFHVTQTVPVTLHPQGLVDAVALSLSKERGGNSLKSLLPDNHRLKVISTERLEEAPGQHCHPLWLQVKGSEQSAPSS